MTGSVIETSAANGANGYHRLTHRFAMDQQQQGQSMDARSIASSMNSSRPFSPFEPKASTLDSPLHRSATTSRMLTPTPPRAFGGTIYMMKDEHERERQRWQTRMEEIEERLALSETLNSDMNNIKADLNKKIVELEKTQKPIGDQNRKLAERNKNLSHEQKRIEKEMAEMKDALITIRDSHDRLIKENAHLREKRVFPQEKMDELERLRTQILEHSKCITALRQSGLEKDRRYDVMVQKFKRLKKCIRKTSEEPGDDNRSTVESTCSEESSLSLDPILEDFEECLREDVDASFRQLFRENEELQSALQQLKESAPTLDEVEMLRKQLSLAHSTVAQQQIQLNGQQEQIGMLATMQEKLGRQHEKIRQLEECVENLRAELIASREQNELIEFQMLEKSTEMEVLQESMLEVSVAEEAFEETQEATGSNLNQKQVKELKERLKDLKNSKSLPLADRQSVVNLLAYMENLEEAFQATTAQSRDWGKREEDYVDRIHRLQEEVDSSNQKWKQAFRLEIQLSEMKQTTLELERAKEGHLKDIEKLKIVLQQKEDLLAKKGAQNENDEEKETLREEVARLEAEVKRLKDAERPTMKTDLERRYEETKYRLASTLEKCHQYEIFIEAAKKRESKGIVESLQEEILEIKTYNEHLERQFQAQSDIIETLKQKIIQNRNFAELLQKCSTLPTNGELQREIDEFEQTNKNKEMRKGVDSLRSILQDRFSAGRVAPLEIQLSQHAKVRPSHSTDSSGCLSTGSDGMGSPLEGGRTSDEEWPQHGSKPLSACERSISA